MFDYITQLYTMTGITNMAQQEIQDEILKNMSPQKKLEVAMNLYFSARQIKAAWFRHLHKDWTDQQVEQAVREVFINART